MKKNRTILTITLNSIIMKHFLFFLIMSICFGLNAQNSKKTGTLTINLTNFDVNEKYVQVALYNSEATWLKKPLHGKKELVENGETIVVFEKLPYGKYAISCFYDINNNNDLDTSFLGLPKEPIGFSNNASAKYGPPSWKNASFTIKNEEEKTNIKF